MSSVRLICPRNPRFFVVIPGARGQFLEAVDKRDTMFFRVF